MLTLWHPARAFAKFIELDMTKATTGCELAQPKRKLKWTEILNQYKSMKQLANLINTVNGDILTFFLCSSILGYGLQLAEMFKEFKDPNWRQVVLQVFNIISDIIVYALAAHLCEKVILQ